MNEMALHEAVLAGDETTVRRLLIDGPACTIAARDQYGQQPLHFAASEPIAALLLEAGADPNAGDNFGNTPLFDCRTPEIADILIKHGADVNARRPDGWTPLLAAIYSGNIGVLQLLIARGANRSHRSNDGTNALCLICDEGNDAMLRLLLEFPDVQSAINQGDNDGVTPLHIACLEGNKNIVRLLVENGALTNIKSTVGITALDLASNLDDPDLAKILRKGDIQDSFSGEGHS
jgi:ankyrin repeat protein